MLTSAPAGRAVFPLLRSARNNGAAISLIGARPSVVYVCGANLFAAASVGARSKSSAASTGSAGNSPAGASSSTAPRSGGSPARSTTKFAQWDGLVNGAVPALKHVRSWPIVGSAIPLLSGTPSINALTNAYDYWPAMRNRYGEFYTFGWVAGGKPDDIYRTCYVVNDPREYVKIVRAGGKHPSGLLEILWVNVRWAESRGMPTPAIHTRGEEWRRIRTFFQTDLLHPDAARGYLPGIIKAAGLASKGAAAAAERQSSGEDGALNSYLDRCSFDMFASMMLGIYAETADVTTPSDPENERFVESAVQGLGTAVEILFSPYELFVGKLLGFETKKMKHCFEGFNEVQAIADENIIRFRERKEQGQLSENEKASYLNRAFDRQKEEGSNVTVDEVKEMARQALNAAVDTTSSVMGWNLCHIARLPNVQEKLHQEISDAVEKVGQGQITAEVLQRSNTPYLHSLIRETHRVTPAFCIGINKSVDADGISIHGHKMEKEEKIILDSYSVGMNPDLIDDPEEFRPKRWCQDAVEVRKGTRREVVDHPFLATPFSQGARRCPGSRVASNEILVMLSQLVLDWKISSPISELRDIEHRQRTTLEAKLPNLKFEAR